ncbi:hypothetical protein PRNP1_009583 [Phytophthora ramorum]
MGNTESSELVNAVRDRDIERVKRLVRGGANVDTSDTSGHTALTLAARTGDLELVRYLVQQGADKEARDRGNNTAVMGVAVKGGLEVVSYLAGQETIKDAGDYAGVTLMKAACGDHLEVVRCLVEQGANKEARRWKGETAVISAASFGHLEVVRYLVEQGANKEATGGSDKTALILAAQKGHLGVVSYLVEQGANKEAKSGSDKTALISAAQKGHLGVVSYLVEQGANKEAKDTDGNTALTRAAGRDHLEVVSYLTGTHQDRTNATTALLRLVREGPTKAAHVLLDAGVDASCLDSNESTALVLLLLREDITEKDICPLAKKLVQHGTPPLKSNKDGKSAKSIARVRGFHHVEALVDEYASKPTRPTIVRGEPEAEESTWYISPSAVSRKQTPFASGGFGKVCHARWSNSHVVLKEIAIHSDADMKRFRREANVWSDNKHPNIVHFYGANDRHEPYFIISEYASNGELLKYLGKEGQGIVWRKMLEVAAGLSHLHDNGVVHGDLKGDNIVVSSNGTAMLTDFGLSFHPSGPSSIQERKSTLGAMQWRAPEYATMTVTDPSFESDVYSLGMCIIEAVTGAIPWGGGWRTVEIREKLRTMERVVEKPGAMADDEWQLVEKMTSPQRQERPKMHEVLASLEKFAAREKDEQRRKACPYSSTDS